MAQLAVATFVLAACGGSPFESPLERATQPSPDRGSTGSDSGSATCESTRCAGSDASAPLFDAAVDVASAPLATFELLANGSMVRPLSCPSAHWEVSALATTLTLRNTGTVPLAYLAEQGSWDLGAQYSPGVPTGMSMEAVGVLAPGADIVLASRPGGYQQTALLGASRPFSIYDGGFAAADEWTIPWPPGVAGSGGSRTMYVAEIEDVSACGPVDPP